MLASSLEYKICCMRSSAQSHQGSPESKKAYIVTYKCTTKIVIPQLLIEAVQAGFSITINDPEDRFSRGDA